MEDGIFLPRLPEDFPQDFCFVELQAQADLQAQMQLLHSSEAHMLGTSRMQHLHASAADANSVMVKLRPPLCPSRPCKISKEQPPAANAQQVQEALPAERTEDAAPLQQQQQRNPKSKRQRLLGTVRGLQRELTLAFEREAKSEELASNMQLVLANDLPIAPRSRRAIFNVAAAYAETLEPPSTDRSVGKAGRLAWHQEWTGGDQATAIVQGVWHGVVCCDAQAEMTWNARTAVAEKSFNLQQLIRDPGHVFLARLKTYSALVNNLLDQADGNVKSAEALQACEVALEFLAAALAKAGRFPAKYNQNQDALVLQSELRPKQQHFHGVLAAMNLTLQQKQQALKLRKSFWVEMGRLLWYREKLLLQLQDAAMQLENEAEADLATWISQPLPICRQVVQIMGELSQTMGYQRYLMRNCQYSLMLEVLSPMQYTILLGRSVPFEFDVAALLEAIAAEQNAPGISRLQSRHFDFPMPRDLGPFINTDGHRIPSSSCS